MESKPKIIERISISEASTNISTILQNHKDGLITTEDARNRIASVILRLKPDDGAIVLSVTKYFI